MLFGFFDTKMVDSLAAWVAKELPKEIPAVRCEYGSEFTTKRLAKFEIRLRSRIASQKDFLSLNFYQKAKLGLSLQKELSEAGFDEKFYRKYSYELVLYLAHVTSQKAKINN